MIFLNPFVWFLSPIIFLPFVWHLDIFKKKQILRLPSLFFAKKVFHQMPSKSSKNMTLEIFLEIFFLFCLLFLLSGPKLVSQKQPLNNQTLLIFLDNSFSMGHQTQRNLLYEKKITPFFNDSRWKEIKVFDMSMVLDQHQPFLLATKQSLLAFLQKVKREYRSFQFKHLEQYLNHVLSLPKETYVLYLISDFNNNHFQTPFFNTKSVWISKNSWSLSSSFFVEKDFSFKKVYFLGESIPLNFKLLSSLSLKGYTCEIKIDQKRLYLDAFKNKKNQSIQFSFLPKKTGLFPVELVIKKEKEIFYRYFSCFLVASSVFLGLQGSLDLQQAFKKAFLYDFEKGYIRFESHEKSIHVFLSANFKSLKNLNLSKKSILFLSSKKDVFFWNDFLKQKGFQDIVFEEKVYLEEKDFILAQRSLGGVLKDDFKKIGYFDFLDKNYVFRLKKPFNPQIILLLLVNDLPVAFLKKNTLLFPFGLRNQEESLSFFENPEGLILFYEGLFRLLSNQTMMSVDGRGFNDLANFQKEGLFLNHMKPGLYQSKEKVFILNVPREEALARPVEKKEEFFKAIKLIDDERGWLKDDNLLTFGFFFRLKEVLKISLLLSLGGLFLMFLQRNKFQKKRK